MRHDFIDKYSRGDSPVHRLDARVKLVATTVLLIGVVTTPRTGLIEFLMLGIVPIGVCAASRVPLSHLFRKSAIVIPFLLVLAPVLLISHRGDAAYAVHVGVLTINISGTGVALLAEIAAKTIITVMTVITLMATTPFDGLLHGLQQMRCPGLIVALLSFMYRYIFLLVDEGERMTVARESRTVRMGAWRSLLSLAHLVGALFVRTFERGERIYGVMVSRGFTGEIVTVQVTRLAKADVIVIVVSVLYIVGVRYVGHFYE